MPQRRVRLEVIGSEKRHMMLRAYLADTELFAMPVDTAKLSLVVVVQLIGDVFRSLGYEVRYQPILAAVLYQIN